MHFSQGADGAAQAEAYPTLAAVVFVLVASAAIAAALPAYRAARIEPAETLRCE